MVVLALCVLALWLSRAVVFRRTMAHLAFVNGGGPRGNLWGMEKSYVWTVEVTE